VKVLNYKKFLLSEVYQTGLKIQSA